MYRQGKAWEGPTDGRDLSQHQADLNFPESTVSGAVVAGRFGPRGERWSQTDWNNFFASPLRWPEGRLATRTVALAATVTLVIALAAAIVTVRHFSFIGAVIVAIGATFLASVASAALARFRQDQTPSPAEEQAAVMRIQTIVLSLMDRYSIEEPEIKPPVKLIDTSGAPIANDFDRRLAGTQIKSSEFFLSQFVARPRLTAILGELGAGKTSLLLRLTHRMLMDRSDDRRDLIPLFLKCRDWSEEYNTFQSWVTATALKSYEIPVNVSDYWIRAGKMFIALDGLHELPDDHFEGFSKAINSWIQAAEGTRLAISSTMDTGVASRVRSLGVDQVCVIQPLPDLELQRLLRRTLSKLNFQVEVPAVREMDLWMHDLILRNEQLRGPALIGLLSEAIEESEQLPDDIERHVDNQDPASVAFLVANSFFSRGDFAAARDSYGAITRLGHSRWRVSAYILLATCLYLLGDVEKASDTMIEAVSVRLHESVRATPDAVEPLSEQEIQCLAAIPFDLSLDIAQISSAANLPLSQSSQALQTLREHGLVETVANTGDRARFRRSIAATSSR